jgi:hypothetical protein
LARSPFLSAPEARIPVGLGKILAQAASSPSLLALAMKNSEMAVTSILVLGLESILAFLLGMVVFRESAGAGRIVAVGLVTCFTGNQAQVPEKRYRRQTNSLPIPLMKSRSFRS